MRTTKPAKHAPKPAPYVPRPRTKGRPTVSCARTATPSVKEHVERG